MTLNQALILFVPKKNLNSFNMNITQLQSEVRAWQSYNFPNSKPYQPLLGLIEEVGELSHAHLKTEQQIRLDEDHSTAAKDAVGDIIIYLADYCNRNNIDMEAALITTWAEVKRRDWIKYPNSKGLPPV